MIDNTKTPTYAQVREIEEKLMKAMLNEVERKSTMSKTQVDEWMKSINNDDRKKS